MRKRRGDLIYCIFVHYGMVRHKGRPIVTKMLLFKFSLCVCQVWWLTTRRTLWQMLGTIWIPSWPLYPPLSHLSSRQLMSSISVLINTGKSISENISPISFYLSVHLSYLFIYRVNISKSIILSIPFPILTEIHFPVQRRSVCASMEGRTALWCCICHMP